MIKYRHKTEKELEETIGKNWRKGPPAYHGATRHSMGMAPFKGQLCSDAFNIALNKSQHFNGGAWEYTGAFVENWYYNLAWFVPVASSLKERRKFKS